jgi:hypothetical protein
MFWLASADWHGAIAWGDHFWAVLLTFGLCLQVTFDRTNGWRFQFGYDLHRRWAVLLRWWKDRDRDDGS